MSNDLKTNAYGLSVDALRWLIVAITSSYCFGFEFWRTFCFVVGMHIALVTLFDITVTPVLKALKSK